MKTLRPPIYGFLTRVKGLYITGEMVWFLYCYFSLSGTVAVSAIALSYHSLEGVKVSLSLYQFPGGKSKIPSIIDPPVSSDYQVGSSYHVSCHLDFCSLLLSALGNPRFTYAQGSTHVFGLP